MICKRILDNRYFNYSFINENIVEVYDPYKPQDTEKLLYENWLKNYIIIDKWRTIKIN